MDRKTLIAVVLSVVIIVGGMLLQQVIFPPKPQPAAPAATQPAPQATGQQVPVETAQTPPAAKPPNGQTTAAQAPSSNQAPAAAQPAPGTIVAVVEPGTTAPPSGTLVRETDLFRLTFSRDGAALSSVQLKKFRNVDGSLVDMVILSDKEQMPFEISFGDYKAPWTTVPFALKETVDSGKSVFDFSRTFLSPGGVPFTLHKTYTFYQGEYVMQLDVTLENSVNEIPNLGTGDYAYTIGFGPQIGPHFAKLDGRNDYRSFVYYADGKVTDLHGQSGNTKEIAQRVTWAGIVGKYFTVIGVPGAADYRIVFDGRKTDPKVDRSTMYYERPALKSAKTQDTFRYYMGPKKKDILARYNQAENNRFGINSLYLDRAVSGNVLSWLAELLKYLLDFFFKLIPNYGVAIILLTLFTKLVFLPLTFKSSEATARMQALNPKMAEIREKYKGKPERMNQEIAALYKREKVNPLSGCLPLLLQIPIFFALYTLLNDYFELRGAMFIPGWIPDLSVPESVWNFGFTIPLVNWTALRVLPLLMLATQFLQTKFTQPADASQSGAQMKLFSYVLPAVFLFILYDMPSGLVLYWTVQNILSIFQQLYINNVNKRKKELAAKAAMETRTNFRRR
jgi:YidC/Oxa1 family membrane protein insertase